jgi:hypothetical protein
LIQPLLVVAVVLGTVLFQVRYTNLHRCSTSHNHGTAPTL